MKICDMCDWSMCIHYTHTCAHVNIASTTNLSLIYLLTDLLCNTITKLETQNSRWSGLLSRGPGKMLLSQDDLPTQYGDYICKEICTSEGYGPKQTIKVYRAGGDPNTPPTCGFPMGGIKS